jgi:hypothetical protein
MIVHNHRGIALLLVVLTTFLVSAITAALVLTTSSDSLTGAAFAAAQQALYAAESMAEWSVADLADPAADWSAIAGGTVASTFADGAPTGARQLGDGTAVDISAVSAANPGWHLYAYGPLDELLPDMNRKVPFYLALLVAPDPTSAERMKIRALSFGPRGAYHAVDARAVRIGSGAALESWRR